MLVGRQERRLGMRRTGMGRVLLHGCMAVLVTAAMLAIAQAADRPYFNQARAVFDNLPARDRNEAFLELMATGDFNAMASDQFGTRLYDATASFQSQHGFQPSGVLTAATRAALSDVGGRIFNSWGLEFLNHPFASAAVAVPSGFGFGSSTTAHGLALENRRRTMSVSFAFFADSEATLQSVFDNLTRQTPGRRVDMQVLRPDFLAVAGATDTTGNYSRYIPVPGGIAGFTLSWNPGAYPNAGRIAVVMANELYPRRMEGSDVFASLPGEGTPISPGSDPGSVQRQQDAQEQVQRQAELDRQQAQARYLEQLRVAREEADRNAANEAARKATEEADRQLALARIKADRLQRARTASEAALKDAADFVKANRADPQLIDHLQRIADLKAASDGSEPDPIDRRRTELQAQLNTDAAYTAWEGRQLAEHQREDERTLQDVVQALTVQRKFLIDRVAEDPTAAYAASFLPLAKKAEAAIASPSLSASQSLMGTIDAAIEKAGLHDTYALAKQDAATLPMETASTKAIVDPARP